MIDIFQTLLEVPPIQIKVIPKNLLDAMYMKSDPISEVDDLSVNSEFLKTITVLELAKDVLDNPIFSDVFAVDNDLTRLYLQSLEASLGEKPAFKPELSDDFFFI